MYGKIDTTLLGVAGFGLFFEVLDDLGQRKTVELDLVEDDAVELARDDLASVTSVDEIGLGPRVCDGKVRLGRFPSLFDLDQAVLGGERLVLGRAGELRLADQV